MTINFTRQWCCFCKVKTTAIMIVLWIFIIQKTDCEVEDNLTKPLLLTDELVDMISSNHNEPMNNQTEMNNRRDCFCGQSNSKRIISTAQAELHEFPWMAYLFIRKKTGTYMCGGFLVTDRHIITAAHCITDTDSTKLTVFLGDHNRTDFTESQSVKVRVSTIKIHPNYNSPSKHENDIAILTLSHHINFAINISPICLPTTVPDTAFVSATVAGWGSMKSDGKSSDVLLKANIRLISNEECEKDYQAIGVGITSKMICAGKDGTDTCQGDSGGPLMIPIDGKYFAIGIVSFGVGCGTLNYPGVYTRVDKLIDFIQDNINGKTCINPIYNNQIHRHHRTLIPPVAGSGPLVH